MTNSGQKIVIIAGPTASGKSGLAIELALYFGAEIVNADSMQVYRGMDVGTAKPSIGERKGVPHHLLDVVDPDEDFNAALYRSLAISALRDIASRGKACFVVGGTGLYIRSLLGGLFRCPEQDPVLRRDLNREFEEYGLPFLYERLQGLDPESARKIHPNDRVRIIRALEVTQLTGQPLSSLIQEHDFHDSPFRALKICLEMNREQLYRRINERTLAMIEEGLAAETETLLRKGYSPDLKSMKAIGYRHMVKYLGGTWDLEEAIARLQADTRRYAKRQLTWFRADPEIHWMKSEELGPIIKRIEKFNEDSP
jgi:tRNA dimethylallyltransferase